jgi:hypothetical protein
MIISLLTPAFGAQIDGVELSSLSDNDFEKIYRV